ncbi:ABC transporter substrate-binding protein, partial [Cylindrospermopsis raciborskii CS-506_A]
ALAFAPDDAASQTPKKGGKLIVARASDISVWDPKYTNDTLTIQAQQQIYANLLMTSADGKSVQPSLAERYEVSEDGRVYTFKLRSNAKFCDGSPITAEDVKFTFDRAMEKDSRVPWQFPNKPAVEAPDPSTVKITLDRANVAFARYLTLWGTHVVSKAYTEKVGQQEMGQKPLGSGAFCLDRFVKGQVTTLKRNPGYWDPEKPYLDEIE